MRCFKYLKIQLYTDWGLISISAQIGYDKHRTKGEKEVSSHHVT